MTIRWSLVERTKKLIAQDPDVFAGDPARLGVTVDKLLELIGDSDEIEGGDPVLPL